MVKNLPAMKETWVQSLGWDNPLEKKMVTHSSILTWEIHGQRSLAGYSLRGRMLSYCGFIATALLLLLLLLSRFSRGRLHATP